MRNRVGLWRCNSCRTDNGRTRDQRGGWSRYSHCAQRCVTRCSYSAERCVTETMHDGRVGLMMTYSPCRSLFVPSRVETLSTRLQRFTGGVGKEEKHAVANSVRNIYRNPGEIRANANKIRDGAIKTTCRAAILNLLLLLLLLFYYYYYYFYYYYYYYYFLAPASTKPAGKKINM